MKYVKRKIFRPAIYKITNPEGRIYIGQTMEWVRRRREYIRYSKGLERGPSEMTDSLLKHGWEAHLFEVIHELPKDVSRQTLLDYEYFVYYQYKEAGYDLMNLQECGTGVLLAEKSKRLTSEKLKAVWTDEFREKQRKRKLGKPIHSQEEKERRRVWMKENRHKWRQYKFTEEDTRKGQEARAKKIEETGSYWDPEKFEEGRRKKSRKILNTKTGEIFYGCKKAAESCGMTEDNLRKKLKGQYANNTPFIFI